MALSKEDIKELSPTDLTEKVIDTKLILKKIEFLQIVEFFLGPKLFFCLIFRKQRDNNIFNVAKIKLFP